MGWNSARVSKLYWYTCRIPIHKSSTITIIVIRIYSRYRPFSFQSESKFWSVNTSHRACLLEATCLCSHTAPSWGFCYKTMFDLTACFWRCIIATCLFMFDCNSLKMSTQFCFWFHVCLVFLPPSIVGQTFKNNQAKMIFRNVAMICCEWSLMEHLPMIDQPPF